MHTDTVNEAYSLSLHYSGGGGDG